MSRCCAIGRCRDAGRSGLLGFDVLARRHRPGACMPHTPWCNLAKR